MNRWAVCVITVAVIAIIVIIAGQWLSRPAVLYAGGALFGLAGVMIGAEAMVRRRIVLRSRYDRHDNETYVGTAALAQGFFVIVTGVFVMGVSYASYFNTGRAVFQYFVHRPGLALLFFGICCLLAALIAIAGSVEQKQGAKWLVILDLLSSRLLPGLILIIIGLAMTALGLLEMVTPQTFDRIGGAFIETLFTTR